MANRKWFLAMVALLALPVLGLAAAKAGLEVVADQNVAAGTLSPGQTAIVMEVLLQNAAGGEPVYITGLAIGQDAINPAYVAAVAPVGGAPLQRVEVLRRDTGQVLAVIDAGNPAVVMDGNTFGWDFWAGTGWTPVNQNPVVLGGPGFPVAPRTLTGIMIPAGGELRLQVRVTVDPTYAPPLGLTPVVRPMLAIWTREGSENHVRIAVDGTEERISPAGLANQGFEIVTAVEDTRTEAQRVLQPGEHKVVFQFTVRDLDPDNSPVYITAMAVSLWATAPAGGPVNPWLPGVGPVPTVPHPWAVNGYWVNEPGPGGTDYIDITHVWIKNSAGDVVAAAAYSSSGGVGTWGGISPGITIMTLNNGSFTIAPNVGALYTVPDNGQETFSIEVWVNSTVPVMGRMLQPTVTIQHTEPAAGGNLCYRTVSSGAAYVISNWPALTANSQPVGPEVFQDIMVGDGTIQPGVPTIVQKIVIKDRDADVHTLSIPVIYVANEHELWTTGAPASTLTPVLMDLSSATGHLQRIEILNKDMVVIAKADGGVGGVPDTMLYFPGIGWIASTGGVTIPGYGTVPPTGYAGLGIPDDGEETLYVRVTLDPAAAVAGTVLRCVTGAVIGEPAGLLTAFGVALNGRVAVAGRDVFVGLAGVPYGLETVADRRVLFDQGYVGPGQAAITMEFDLKDADADNLPVTVYGVFVGSDDHNAFDAAWPIRDIIGIELLDKDNQVIATQFNITFPIGTQTILIGGFPPAGLGWVIPDNGTQVLKVRLHLANTANIGYIMRLGVGIIHTEGGVVFIKSANDGPAEEIGTAPTPSPGPGPTPGAFNHTYGSAGRYWVSVPIQGIQAGAFGTTLYRWDGRRWVRLNSTDVLDPTMGYWATLPANKALSLTGTEITTDVTIALQKGYNIISSPWRYPVSAILVTRGSETRTWEEAVRAGWVSRTVTGYQASRYVPAGELNPWYGYRVRARVDGLTLTLRYASRLEATAAPLAPMGVELLDPDWDEPMPEPEGVLLEGLKFVNTPNPITDVHTTTFKVVGPMSEFVNEIKVQIFDLSGKLVWEGSAAGAELEWHTEDFAGRYLANGVYLFRIQVEVAGTWVSSGLMKLAILR